MEKQELDAALDLLHAPAPKGFNLGVATPVEEEHGDDASVSFYHKGLTYTFYELVDVVNFTTEQGEVQALKDRVLALELLLDA